MKKLAGARSPAGRRDGNDGRGRTGAVAGLSGAVLAVVALLALPGTGVAATTYTVNTTADNAPTSSECSGAPGDCSLRQALAKATSGDTVSVPANPTAYRVTGSAINIPDGVSVVGGGAAGTTVTGGDANQIFEIDVSGGVSISAITLTHGFHSGSDEGGAINLDDGDLTLDQVAITDSHSQRYGGAIEGTGDGHNITITRSRFSGDTTDEYGGGAIDFFPAGGKLTISDTVFTGNSSGDRAGAVLVEGASTFAFDRVTFDGNSVGSASSSGGGAFEAEDGGTLHNVTFTGNSAPLGGALYVDFSQKSPNVVSAVNVTFDRNSSPTGADVDVDGGAFSTQNSIFAAPQGGGTSCAGGVTDNGNNLEDASTSSCGFTAAQHDIVGQNPQLASGPADNGNTVATAGGPPQTLALSATSPALRAADAAGCSAVGSVDERKTPRPGDPGAACDIGAFELQFHTLTVTVNGTGSGSVTGGGITCPGTCSQRYPEGTPVSLAATAASGWSFSGWSGGCAGTAGCGVTMSADRAVTATFTANPVVAPSRHVVHCVVPRLKRHTLAGARKMLRRAHCRLGRVTGAHAARRPGTLRVTRFSPRAGRVLPRGSRVNVTVAAPVRRTARAPRFTG